MSRLQSIGSALRHLWLLVGITLLSLAAIEGTATLGFLIYDRFHYAEGDVRATADTYGNAAWVPNYWAEFHRSWDDMRWQSYVYWRRRPRQSAYINVDERGIRATPTSATPGVVKIFMFGGSTMWGTGARDEFTIPSILARELGRRGISAAVTNFGESGWVSTQELVALALELRQGNRPNLVIFYDGVNDTYTAFQLGGAGIPQNEYNRVLEFNFLKKPVIERARLVGRDAALRLSMRRLIEVVRSYADDGVPVKADETAPGFSMDDKSKARLAGQVIDTYASNVEMVAALGQHYQFKSLFYWQPLMFDKPHRTDYEKQRLAEIEPATRFFHETHQAFRDRHSARMRDLSAIFLETTAPLFVDFMHLGETGNEIVVQHMLPDVVAEIIELNRGSNASKPIGTAR